MSRTSGVVDAIVLELIQTRLTSVVREMRSIMIRTARSPMIHEGHDFSCAVLSPAGELVAASEVERPTHLSALPFAERRLAGMLERWGVATARDAHAAEGRAELARRGFAGDAMRVVHALDMRYAHQAFEISEMSLNTATTPIRVAVSPLSSRR